MSGTPKPDRAFDLVDRALRLPPSERVPFVRSAGAPTRVEADALALLAAVTSVGGAEAIPGGGGPSTMVGSSVGGFRAIRPIGCGASAVVYEAEQSSPRRMVALKILRPACDGEPCPSRAEHEAMSGARLRHPAIASVFAAGIAEVPDATAVSWIAMELVDGAMNSTEFARASGDVRAVERVFIGFAEAIGAAHAAGIVHRDVKPANLLVSGSGEPKVVDFGLASGDPSDASPVGTARFMAPERRQGKAAAAGSDVWSLGACLAEALRAARVPRSHALWAIAGTATADDSAKRYGDGAAMAADLRAASSGGWLRALRGHPVAMIRHQVVSKPRTAAMLAAGALGLSVAAWGAWTATHAGELLMLRDAQRILSMHGEMTASIAGEAAQDRAAAAQRAWDRGMKAIAPNARDAEVAFLSVAALLQLGETPRACELAAQAGGRLRSAGMPADELAWLELLESACTASSAPADGAAAARLCRHMEKIASSSRSNDFLLGCYVFAGVLQVDGGGFGGLLPEVIGRIGLAPGESITGCMLEVVAVADAGIDWPAQRRAAPAMAGIDRWTLEPYAGYLAPVFANALVEALPACAKRRDLPRFDAVVAMLRHASARTRSAERVLIAEGYIAAYERAFGLVDRARITLDGMVGHSDASAVPDPVWAQWLPERLKVACAGVDARAEVATIARAMQVPSAAGRGQPMLVAALDACLRGDRDDLDVQLKAWIAARAPGQSAAQAGDDLRLADALRSFVTSH